MGEGKRLVVITGCDSGMGLCLARIMAARGFTVLASYVEGAPVEKHPGIIFLPMDLRDGESIKHFGQRAAGLLEDEHGLFALVNNAGIAQGGPAQDLPLSLYREVMEVNFFGVVDLTRRLMPYLIRDRAMVVIHGSMAGRIALPFLSPYAASKFALEGYADSLRRELKPFGVRTVLLETAGVATPIWRKARGMDMNLFDPKYHGSLTLFLERFVDAGNLGLDQEVASNRICRIIMMKNPRPRYIIGKSVWLSRLEMMIPGRVMDRILKRLFSMNYGS